MRIGIQLAHVGPQTGPDSIRTSAHAAESLGYDSVWVLDRLLAPLEPRSGYGGIDGLELPAEQATCIDPFATLAFAAACTERVRLGTNVLVAPWYPPVALARSLAAIDALSRGRLTIGLGVGWSPDEYDAVGVPMRARGQRLDQFLDVLDAVWGQEVASFRGPSVDLRPTAISPRPVVRPPILLAAYTPGALARVARRADGWSPAGLPVEALAPMFASVRDLAAGFGRNPDALQLVVRANIYLYERPVEGERLTYMGSVDQVLDDLHATKAAGAHEVLLHIHGAATLDAKLEGYAALADGLERPAAAA